MNSDKIEIFRQTELFQGLEESALSLFAERAVEKRLAPREILFLGGEPARGMFVIAKGAIRAFRTGADGREQTIHVERAVTTIAEMPVFDGGSYPSTAAAEEPTIVYFLDKNLVLNASLKHPELALAAVKLMAGRLRRCAELVETLSLREAGQRLANLLLAEGRSHGVKTPNGVKLKLKLTHNQLASRIGTVREVITRILFRLQNQGLIIHDGKEILIPDIKALAVYADAERFDRFD